MQIVVTMSAPLHVNVGMVLREVVTTAQVILAVACLSGLLD